MKTTTWELRSGDPLLGVVTVTGGDFPWLYGDFAATPAFATVKPLFDRAAQLLDSDDDTWDDAYAAVDALGVRLVDPRTGSEDILAGVFIRGNTISFR
jgi:hypothetical protein